jgi:hypothetical protein
VKKTSKEDNSGIIFEIHRNRNHSITETVIEVLNDNESSIRPQSTQTATQTTIENITETATEIAKGIATQTTTQTTTETATKRPKNKYRIDTKGCKILNWPLFDEETEKLYKNMTQESLECESRQPTIEIKRVNGTWTQLNWTKLDKNPFCYISELRLGNHENSLLFGT